MSQICHDYALFSDNGELIAHAKLLTNVNYEANFQTKMCLIGQMQTVRHKHDVAAAFHVSVRAAAKAATEFNDTGTVTDR